MLCLGDVVGRPGRKAVTDLLPELIRERRIDAVVERLASGVVTPVPPPQGGAVEPRSNVTPGEYCKVVERAKEYIRVRDAFQIVLSQRLETPFLGDPFRAYRALRLINPSPFLTFIRHPQITIAGASPELPTMRV